MGKLPALISYMDKVYRPAGYRLPLLDEFYIAKTGHIQQFKFGYAAPKEVRLILREYSNKDFGGDSGTNGTKEG